MAHIVIGGGSGFIGAALARALRDRGDRVTIISRTPGPERITWSDLPENRLPACDGVVNLAGEHILQPGKRWTKTYRDDVIASRVDTTHALVDAINAQPDPPRVFVSTAGKCFYGTRQMAQGESYPELDEDSAPMGADFPSELVGQWEHAADHLDHDRVRHVFAMCASVSESCLGLCANHPFWAGYGGSGAAAGCCPLFACRSVSALAHASAKGHNRSRGSISMTWWASCST